MRSISSSRGESRVASVSALSRDTDGGTVGGGSGSSAFANVVGSATDTGSGESSLGPEERRVLRVRVLGGSGGGGSSLGESLSGSGSTGNTSGRVHVSGFNNVTGNDTRVNGGSVDRGEGEGREGEGDEAGLEGRHVYRRGK